MFCIEESLHRGLAKTVLHLVETVIEPLTEGDAVELVLDGAMESFIVRIVDRARCDRVGKPEVSGGVPRRWTTNRSPAWPASAMLLFAAVQNTRNTAQRQSRS